MELNDLEADEPSVKSQITVTKKTLGPKRWENPMKSETKNVKINLKLVTNKTLENKQHRYCKDTKHTVADCPKLANWRNLREHPDTEKCQNCNTPGQDDEDCYFGANRKNHPLKWNLTEAHMKSKKPTNEIKHGKNQN